MSKGLHGCWWGIACAVALLLAAVALWVWLTGPREAGPDSRPSLVLEPAAGQTHPASETHRGFLYGRVTTIDGATFQGRLRWGGDEEAFWSEYFNGSKVENPWIARISPERQPRKDLDRPFMARFGDISHIEVSSGDVQVTLKSGTVFDLDRFGAGDFDDGIRVWDSARGVIDLDSRRISAIELLPTPDLGTAPYRLYGTVRTRQGDFTGFVQWDRQESVGSDGLDGRTAEGVLSLRYDTIGSIERRSRESSLVTLLDGREIVLSGSREVGDGNRGIYVDDRRYGRVLISWDAFEHVEFSPAGSGPAYGEFPPGRPLTGSVTTRAGGLFTGRLVFDLDESETSETLDAPSEGVDYTIPFGLIASIVPPGLDERGAPRAGVTLHDGQELQLELAGDLGEGNAGMLIFVEGGRSPEYVPWADVEQIVLNIDL